MCFKFQWRADCVDDRAIRYGDLHLCRETWNPILHFEARFYCNYAIHMELAQMNFLDARRIKSLQTDIFPDPDRRQLRTPVPPKLTRRLANMRTTNDGLWNTERIHAGFLILSDIVHGRIKM